VGTGTTKAGAQSTINYQNVHGAALTSQAASSATNAQAAVTNAAANTRNATTNAKNADTAAINAGNSGRLTTARIAALDDKGEPVNTAEYRTLFYSTQTDADGKNLVLPSGSSNLGRIKGVVEELGLSEAQSAKFAKTEWANLMALREQAVAREKLIADPKGQKTYWSKQEIMQMEDSALTKLTDALTKDKSKEGALFQRASDYAKRRAANKARALKTDKDED